MFQKIDKFLLFLIIFKTFSTFFNIFDGFQHFLVFFAVILFLKRKMEDRTHCHNGSALHASTLNMNKVIQILKHTNTNTNTNKNTNTNTNTNTQIQPTVIMFPRSLHAFTPNMNLKLKLTVWVNL